MAIITQQEYLDSLYVSSYEGVAFIELATEVTTGRKLKVDEYPSEDNQGVSKVQDQGRKKTVITVTMRPTEYSVQAKDVLLRALNKKGIGKLILSNYTTQNVRVQDITTSNEWESSSNVFMFRVVFVVTDDLAFPTDANSQGSLNNNEQTTRESIVKDLLDKINNTSLVRLRTNVLRAVEGRIYPFVDLDSVKSALFNVTAIVDTIKKFVGNIDPDRSDTVKGSAGKIAKRDNIELLTINSDSLLTKINTPTTLVNTVSDLYGELSDLQFVDEANALSVYEELGDLEFPRKNQTSSVLQDINSSTLEYFNRKLALIQYCKFASLKDYKLQEEIDIIINKILSLQAKLNNYFPENLFDVNAIVVSALEILKIKRASLYRLSTENVDSVNLINLSYILFDELKDEDVEIVKNVNPSEDLGDMRNEIVTVINND